MEGFDSCVYFFTFFFSDLSVKVMNELRIKWDQANEQWGLWTYVAKEIWLKTDLDSH